MKKYIETKDSVVRKLNYLHAVYVANNKNLSGKIMNPKTNQEHKYSITFDSFYNNEGYEHCAVVIRIDLDEYISVLYNLDYYHTFEMLYPATTTLGYSVHDCTFIVRCSTDPTLYALLMDNMDDIIMKIYNSHCICEKEAKPLFRMTFNDFIIDILKR